MFIAGFCLSFCLLDTRILSHVAYSAHFFLITHSHLVTFQEGKLLVSNGRGAETSTATSTAAAAAIHSDDEEWTAQEN